MPSTCDGWGTRVGVCVCVCVNGCKRISAFFIICKHCPLHTQTVWIVEHAVTFPYLARPTAFNPYRTSVWCSSGWLVGWVDGDRCMELSQYFNFQQWWQQQLPHYTHVAYSSRSFPWGLYLCVLWCWSEGYPQPAINTLSWQLFIYAHT